MVEPFPLEGPCPYQVESLEVFMTCARDGIFLIPSGQYQTSPYPGAVPFSLVTAFPA
jgi:hypothetical protein